jgi:hypothetical protein
MSSCSWSGKRNGWDACAHLDARDIIAWGRWPKAKHQIHKMLVLIRSSCSPHIALEVAYLLRLGSGELSVSESSRAGDGCSLVISFVSVTSLSLVTVHSLLERRKSSPLFHDGHLTDSSSSS